MTLLEPLGDRAWLAHFDNEDAARAWTEAVRGLTHDHPGILDVVLAFQTVAVYADPERQDLEALETLLRSTFSRPQRPAEDPTDREPVQVPVLYDGEDLEAVSRRLGLSPEEVQTIHARPVYPIRAIGFLPGFPYCGPLPEPLDQIPRRDTPRPRVPAGSVAIAAGQTAIYPRESPGGWHLLGRTPLVIADLESGFFPLRAGDRIRFQPIDEPTFHRLAGQRLKPD